MAGRRGGRRGQDSKLPREVLVSKKLSWLLRHGAEKEGLKLGKGGYVGVGDALNTHSLRSMKISFSEVLAAVRENDKQRLSLVPRSSLLDRAPALSSAAPMASFDLLDAIDPQSASPDDYLIRANQGHSLPLDADGLLTAISAAALPAALPTIVVHGTDLRAWRLIVQSGGLRPMGRNHVHFAQGLPAGVRPVEDGDGGAETAGTQPPVISGMRKSSTVLIYVDIAAALQAGLPFWQSENGVVLSEGGADGCVPCALFKRVELRTRGGRVLMRDGVLVDGGEAGLGPEQRQSNGAGQAGKHKGKIKASCDGGDV